MTLTESLLIKGLKELSLSYTRDQVGLFLTYLSELKRWNRAYNLTALKTDEDIIVKHFLDSLLYLKALPEGEISVLDVGSGAGFPGIPLKIVRPEVSMHLLEPSRKKANFLRHIARVLRLSGIEVIEKRIEEVRSLSVDVVVTRALFSVKDFHRKAFPLLRKGGRLVMSKGPKAAEEINIVEKEGIHCEVLSLGLPLSDSKRFIVIIEKEDENNAVTGHELKAKEKSAPPSPNVCFNAECRLRKAGCRGFEGCPGFKTRS